MIWPPEYLFHALYNARVYGVRFADAWDDAVAEAAGISDDVEGWLEAFEETRAAWEAAFTGKPASRSEEALTAVGVGLELVEDRSVRRCAYCDGWIPVDRDPRALYCSDSCRRLTERERAGRSVPPRKRVPHGPDLDWEVGRSLTLVLAKSLPRYQPQQKSRTQ